MSSMRRVSVSRKMPASTPGNMESRKSLAVAHILNIGIRCCRPSGYFSLTLWEGFKTNVEFFTVGLIVDPPTPTKGIVG